MIARCPRWRRPAAATFLALLCAGAFALQGSREEHWKMVIDLDQAGAELVRRETQSPPDQRDGIRSQRIEVHQKARAELARYIRAWLPEWQSLAYLQAIFRSALYAELSEEWMLALQDYSFCLRHPELGNPESTWKGTPLPGLVEQGWIAVVANVRPPADMTGTWTTRSYLHQKGIQPEVFAMQGQAGHAALDPDHALVVASRMRPERDLAAAGTLGSALLAQAQLDHRVVEQDGLAVLGVGASAVRVHGPEDMSIGLGLPRRAAMQASSK